MKNNSNYLISLAGFLASLLLAMVGMVFLVSFVYTPAQTGGGDCVTIFGLAVIAFGIGYGFRKRSCSVCRCDLAPENQVIEIQTTVCKDCYDKHFCKERLRKN